MLREISLDFICKSLNISFIGIDVNIDGLNLCNRTSLHQNILSYVANNSYIQAVSENYAIKALVIKKDFYEDYKNLHNGNLTFIFSDNPEKTFYEIHDFLYSKTDFYEKFDFDSIIGTGCNIHPSAVVDKGVRIGNNVVIGANTVILKGTVIKDNVTIGCNSTIGSEGFQILNIDGENKKVIHCGGTLIEENVCIGNNVTVGNALFEGNVIIGKNSMIDNHAYIAHNVTIGNNVVITAGTVLCGSCVINDNAWLGANSLVRNRVVVGESAKLGMGSVVTKDIPENSLAYGVPAKITRILYGGGRKLGVDVLKWLCQQPWADVKAICPIEKSADENNYDNILEIARLHNIPVYDDINDLKEFKFDLGLSVNYNKIISEDILNICQKGFYNVHHSYNLRLRGRNITTHAILNSRKENIYYHGTSLHKMVPKLDAGGIVACYSCLIEKSDTAYSLFNKVDCLAYKMLVEWLPIIAMQNFVLYEPPKDYVHYYKKKDLPSREVTENMLPEDIYDVIRAFDFPGFEPAYINRNGKKIYLVLNQREQFYKKINICGLEYYTDNVCGGGYVSIVFLRLYLFLINELMWRTSALREFIYFKLYFGVKNGIV